VSGGPGDGAVPPRVLYVSYDGALEPLGQSQVIAYLERLTGSARLTLLSFEKRADLADGPRTGAMRRRLDGAGIHWIIRRYRKRPPVVSTALDVIAGCRVARRWARETRPGETAIVHSRGYVPALVALYIKRRTGTRFLFDMRGFWVDEKVDAGLWSRGGLLYRVGKWCERRFLTESDAVVSLTAAGVRELPALGPVAAGAPVVVIPTCADLDRFTPDPDPAGGDVLRRELGLGDALVVGYVGTLSNWYLRGETLSYLAWMCRRFEEIKVFMVTREDHDRLRADAGRAGIPVGKLVMTRAAFDDMPRLMRVMDLGVFFIRVCFSKRASAATKLAEFLGCGVPVVINDGIGDSGEIVRDNRVGVVLSDTTPDRFDATAGALDRLLADREAPARCRDLATRLFSLTEGVAQYARLYDRLSHSGDA
jgi:glycosyltransferase involved in cell wall biosynthesis